MVVTVIRRWWWYHHHLHHRRRPSAMAQPRCLDSLHPLLMRPRLAHESLIHHHPPYGHYPYPAMEIKPCFICFLFKVKLTFLIKKKYLRIYVLSLVIFYFEQEARGANRAEGRMDQIRICSRPFAGRIRLDEDPSSVIIMGYPKWS